MPKTWVLRNGTEIAPEEARRFATELGCSPVTAEILLRRRIADPAAARTWFQPDIRGMRDPFTLRGMEGAAERVVQAITHSERIAVFGDYDVDGISSTALLLRFLADCGVEERTAWFLPDRAVDGYGFSPETIERFADDGVKVIVSADCGVSAFAAARRARELGVDLIVTDHHLPHAEHPDDATALPDAYAVVNPNQDGCGFGYRDLAGVGLAFYLCAAVRMRLREAEYFAKQGITEPNLKEYLDLVALGTVADVAPLTGENRMLVSYGLKEIERTRLPGLRALVEVAGYDPRPIGTFQVGFGLAPRMNASGRLAHAETALKMLRARSRQEAWPLAQELDRLNEERRAIEREIFDDCLRRFEAQPERIRRASILLADENWHPGVIGIVASRLVERFAKPTLLIALDRETGKGRGSGRSVEGFHLLHALEACAEHMEQFGGHAMAAGCSVAAESVEALEAAFEEVVDLRLTPEQRQRRLSLDAVIEADALEERVFDEIEAMAPFGAGNPQPILAIGGLFVHDRRVLKERHLKLQLGAGRRRWDAIGFGMAALEVYPEMRVDAAFVPEWNEYGGRRRMQLRLRDLRPHQEEP